MIDRPLIVIQPTPFCNIDCSYCYLPERSSKKSASMELIERIAEAVFEARWWTGTYTFLWHLGEPLSLPTTYYAEAFAIIEQSSRRHDRSYVHSFQTNATLLNQQWVDFLKVQGVRVGVSVDGPAFIHDRCRQTRGGRGTHARTMQGIRLLQAAGVAFGTISVLTNYTLDFADEMLAFFDESGISEIAFNIDELEGIHGTTSFAQGTAGERYRRFLLRILALIEKRGNRIRLRELSKALPPLLHGAAPYNLASQPLRMLTFDCDGNFSSFCPELRAARSDRFQNFVMGNVLCDDLETVLSNPVFEAVTAEVKAGLAKCERECGYWNYCGGGDPSSKFFQHGRFDVTETTTCKIHKQETFNAVVAYLEAKHLPVLHS